MSAGCIGAPVEELPAVVFVDEYVPVPDYIAKVAVLLAETEGHGDPLVRAVRKIAVQALTALDQLAPVAVAPSRPPLDPMPQHEGLEPKVVREWAKRAGIAVAPRGRLKASVIDAYIDAHRIRVVA